MRTVTVETGGVDVRVGSPPSGEPPQLGATLALGFAADAAVLIPPDPKHG